MSLPNDVTQGGTHESLVVHNHGTGIEVIEAPEYARVSIALLFSDPRGLRVHGNMIDFGGHENKWVSYQVVGIEDEGCALLLRRED